MPILKRWLKWIFHGIFMGLPTFSVLKWILVLFLWVLMGLKWSLTMFNASTDGDLSYLDGFNGI